MPRRLDLIDHRTTEIRATLGQQPDPIQEVDSIMVRIRPERWLTVDYGKLPS
jgi:hypothetical protein